MNVNKYRESQKRGLVTVQKYGSSFQAIKRQYDPETGTETVPATGTFTREEIVKQREICAETLDDLDALLADIDALK